MERVMGPNYILDKSYPPPLLVIAALPSLGKSMSTYRRRSSLWGRSARPTESQIAITSRRQRDVGRKEGEPDHPATHPRHQKYCGRVLRVTNESHRPIDLAG